jgi:hypothetical protein
MNDVATINALYLNKIGREYEANYEKVKAQNDPKKTIEFIEDAIIEREDKATLAFKKSREFSGDGDVKEKLMIEESRESFANIYLLPLFNKWLEREKILQRREPKIVKKTDNFLTISKETFPEKQHDNVILTLYESLIKENFISSNTNLVDFKNLFSGNPIAEYKGAKIAWIDKEKKFCNRKTLFAFLIHLEDKKIVELVEEKKGRMTTLVLNFFCDDKGEDFLARSLSSTKSEFTSTRNKKSGNKEKIIYNIIDQLLA